MICRFSFNWDRTVKYSFAHSPKHHQRPAQTPRHLWRFAQTLKQLRRLVVQSLRLRHLQRLTWCPKYFRKIAVTRRDASWREFHTRQLGFSDTPLCTVCALLVKPNSTSCVLFAWAITTQLSNARRIWVLWQLRCRGLVTRHCWIHCKLPVHTIKKSCVTCSMLWEALVILSAVQVPTQVLGL